MQQHAYKNYLLTVLLLVLAFNYIDRLALGLLMQDIKAEFSLTDTQLGFLTGLSFAIFYAFMGIPIARWADRGNRVTIISVTAALWSVAVALCGAAASFMQLLLIRVGVAIGEAGCQPPALSLISDHFNRSERPRAVARYMWGYALALVIGPFAAGWLNQLYGWRTTLVLVGMPGLVLAVLARFTLREPRLDPSHAQQLAHARVGATAATDHPRLLQVFTTLWKIKAFRHLLFCFSVTSFFSYGILQWSAPFFMRTHGLSSGELGMWMAGIHGVAGLLGNYAGGELAARYAPDNERLQLVAIAVLYAMLTGLKACVYLAPSLYSALVMLLIVNFVGAIGNGPIFAATQTLVPPATRATAVAIILFFSNLIGMGLGPVAVGVLSDLFRSSSGEDSLRYALLCVCPGYFWAAWHLWRAGRTAGDATAAKSEAAHLQSESTQSSIKLAVSD